MVLFRNNFEPRIYVFLELIIGLMNFPKILYQPFSRKRLLNSLLLPLFIYELLQ